jgi:PAS domain S-box-containing protein
MNDPTSNPLLAELEALREENARLKLALASSESADIPSTPSQLQQNLNRSILDSLPAPTAVINTDGIIVAINRAWEEFASAQGGDLAQVGVGGNYFRACETATEAARNEAERARQGIQAVLSGQSEQFDLTYPCLSPTELRWFLMRAVPLLGPLQGVVISHIDVTDLQLALDALHASEARYRQIVETAQEGIWIINQEGITTLVNERMATMLGYSVAEIMGRSFLEFMDAEAQKEAEAYFALRRQGVSEKHDFRFLHRNGSPVWAMIATNPITSEQGEFLGAMAMVADITERKKIEDALRNALQRLTFHVENSPLAVIEWDQGFVVRYWSAGAERIFGWKSEEIVGKHVFDWAFVHPEDRETVEPVTRELQQGTQARNFSAHRNLTKSGATVYCEWYNSVLYDEHQKVTSILSLALDVTERKRLEAQLLQAQKMESIGRLAGGIAHDFNNMLTAILGYAALLEEDLPPDSEAMNYVRNIRMAGERSADLTNQLLAFARRQMVQPKVASLFDMIHALDPILRRLIGENIRLDIRPCAQPMQVRMDTGQFGQVLVNLILNARDAIIESGAISIEMMPMTLDADFVQAHPDMQPGRYAALIVRDTGVGIPAEALPHIFEPFFTTKELGHGTGLGLATCYGIVKQNGGHITVESEPLSGTTFRLYFPLVDEEIQPETPRSNRTLPTGTETVLLVEDEELVRDFLARALEERGYTVLQAANGEAACEIEAACSGPIDLLLTDVVMPKMSGPALAERLRAVRPQIKVVFMSGYTENTVVNHGVHRSEVAFLQKPCTAAELARKMREWLDPQPCATG